jgi:hypothetical protein
MRTLVGALTVLVLGACAGGNLPAPNLLSPRPSPDADVAESGRCWMFPMRAQPISGRQLFRELGDYTPSWLPDGFGLVGGWKGSAVIAIWIDGRCNTIRLEVHGVNPFGATAPLGAWHLAERGFCTYGDGAVEHRVSCVSWTATSGNRALGSSTSGVSEAVAARVRDGISLSG